MIAKIINLSTRHLLCHKLLAKLSTKNIDEPSYEYYSNLNAEKIVQLSRSFMPCISLLSAVELNLFESIGTERLTAEIIAKKSKVSPVGTAKLLDVLVAQNLIKKTDRFYENSDLSKNFLVPTSKAYLDLKHTVDMFKNWANLSETVKKGKTLKPKSVNDWNPKEIEAFIAAMHSKGKADAKEISNHIDFSSVNSILDLGGGSGIYSFEFLRKKEGMTSTIFDLPKVVGETKKYIEKEGFSARTTLMAGDFISDPIGKRFDLIYVSDIVHMFSNETNANLVKKCAEALNEGGQLVIYDFLVNDERTGPLSGLLFALHMFVFTEGGDSYSEKEIIEWMKNAGLTYEKKVEIGCNRWLVIAKK